MRARTWLLSLALAMVGCRYGYEQLGLEGAGVPPGGGATAGGSAGGGSTAVDGGEPSTGGGSGGTEPVTPSGGAGAPGASGTGNDAGSAGAGGSSSGGGTPPDPALCVQASFGGHDYLLCEEARAWLDANTGCIAAGMRLVRIDSAEENQWLYDNANVPAGGVPPHVWIGATDAAEEGVWRWTDGEQFWLGDLTGTPQNALFTAWYFREPNNVSTIEHCASMSDGAAEWYDSDCDRLWPFICESL